MNRRRTELIIVTALIIVFVILLVRACSRPKRPQTPAAPQPAQVQSEPAAPVPAQPKGLHARQRQKDLVWGRDPFRLTRTKNISPDSDLIVNGIIWDENNPYAIINGKVVIAGDYINGNLVVYIGKNSIILDNGTEQFELKVWE